MTDIGDRIHAARLELALELEAMPRAQRIEAMQASRIETGGTIIPAGNGNWGPHFAEIDNLGVSHQGAELDEAIAHWIRAVLRIETAMALETAA